jgi:hypothetical protein
MEGGSTSETPVNFYQATRRNIQEDSRLYDKVQFYGNDRQIKITFTKKLRED